MIQLRDSGVVFGWLLVLLNNWGLLLERWVEKVDVAWWLSRIGFDVDTFEA